MHQSCHRTQDALRMVHQPNQLAHVRSASQIDHSLELGMIMMVLPHLDKLDLPAEIIHNLLKPIFVPPFDREIEFPARHHDPKWCALPGKFMDL